MITTPVGMYFVSVNFGGEFTFPSPIILLPTFHPCSTCNGCANADVTGKRARLFLGLLQPSWLMLSCFCISMLHGRRTRRNEKPRQRRRKGRRLNRRFGCIVCVREALKCYDNALYVVCMSSYEDQDMRLVSIQQAFRMLRLQRSASWAQLSIMSSLC